jgi:menaquinone-dependent protoporphyrinogen IX oxidase
MKIELYHASKNGNGAKVAEEFKRLMTMKGHTVEIHHIDDSRPKDLPPAGLYVFGSPTRIGKPVGGMRRFLKKVDLPSGTKYAVFATHGAAKPDKKSGKMPTEDELAKYQRNIPIMDELLRAKGMVKVAEMKAFVVDLKGPLENGWQKRVEAFVADILMSIGA